MFKTFRLQPLSEIKRQLWDKVLKRDRTEQPNFNVSVNEDGNNENGSSSNAEVTQEALYILLV